MNDEKCRTIYSSLPGCSTVHKDTHLKLIVIIYVTRKLFYHFVVNVICRDKIVATIYIYTVYIYRASKCKLLGSLLDKYINQRTIRGMDAFKTLNAKFDNRQISNTANMRTFNASFANVFLYEGELCTLTKKLLCHLKRLHPDTSTPARLALTEYYMRKVKRHKGRPQRT